MMRSDERQDGDGRASGRVFLFLQGPHGPFVRHLAAALRAEGAAVRRIAFNASDAVEWTGAGPLQRYRGPEAAFGDWLDYQLRRHAVTDIVLYGDSRPEHAAAIAVAGRRRLVCHCLEEGYLRPWCITYERGGSNGNSRLHRIGAAEIARAIGPAAPPDEPAPDGWGAHRAHLWHSARYHARLLLPSRHFHPPPRRRGIALWREGVNYAGRALGLPWRRVAQGLQGHRLLTGGRPYFLVLLQLSFDESMRAYSDYATPAAFIADCIAAFAEGAPAGALLVFKSHPFEDGRDRLRRVIRHRAEAAGVAGRVLFLDGGLALSPLLDGACGAVTINSTAGQQALWRGVPVAALGRAVYARPGLVSDQPLAAFFAAPRRPDQQAYWQFRAFLTRSSQIRGSFYDAAGIARAVRALPDAMMSPLDPYERALGVVEGAGRVRLPEPGPGPERDPEMGPETEPNTEPLPQPIAV